MTTASVIVPALSAAERYVMRHLHGNTRENREIRAKLRECGCKYCIGCHTVLAASSFYPAPKANNADGIAAHCKDCVQKSKRGTLVPKASTLREVYHILQTRDAERDREAGRARHRRRKRARLTRCTRGTRQGPTRGEPQAGPRRCP